MPRSASANIDVDTGVQVGAAGPRSRYFYDHQFRKVPILATALVVDSTHDVDRQAQIESDIEANLDWVTGGTNTEVVATAVNGGVSLTTAGASADSCWLQPNTSTSIASGLHDIQWDTDNSPAVEWAFTTGDNVSDCTITAGFVLAQDEPYDVSGDADRIQFEYVAGDGTNGNNVVLTYSVGGTDYEHPFSFELAVSTTYWCKIAVDSGRYADCHFGMSNDPGSAVHHRTKNALTADILDLKPSINLQTATGAKSITAHSVALGRNYT